MLGTWRTFGIFVLAAAALSGCEKAGEAVSAATDAITGGATAKSLSAVRTIYLNTESCKQGISAGLSERGYAMVGKDDKKDAVLEVTITHQGRNLDNIPNFGGVGNKASYSAQMLGADDKVLFTASGSEGSVNMEELCQDIGDNLGERLRGR